MSLSYPEMLALKNELEQQLLGWKLEKLELLEEKTWLFFFVGPQENEEKRILVSARYPFSRFHLSQRRRGGRSTPFEKRVLEKIGGKKLNAVELIGEDRILGLVFDGHRFIAELMYKNPLVAVTDSHGAVLVALKEEYPAHYYPPAKKHLHDSLPAHCTSAQIEKKYEELAREADFHSIQLDLVELLKKKLKKNASRIELHQKELEEASRWREFEHTAEMLKTYFYLLKRGMHALEIEDWETGKKITIPLDPASSPEEIVKSHFKRVRKLKRRLVIARQLIDSLEKEREELTASLQKISEVKEKEGLAPFIKEFYPDKRGGPKDKVVRAHPFREYCTAAGLSIFVGKNDRDNDRLTFQFARGSDLWMHAANFPGSHVVLQMKKGQEADEESLKDAMALALHFSKAKGSAQEEVVIAECKFLKKRKGAPAGQVNVSRQRTRLARLDPDRLQRLFLSCKDK